MSAVHAHMMPHRYRSWSGQRRASEGTFIDVQANGLSEYYSEELSFSREVSMTISLKQVLIWIVIAAVVGVVGELIARRRAPDGIYSLVEARYRRVSRN